MKSAAAAGFILLYAVTFPRVGNIAKAARNTSRFKNEMLVGSPQRVLSQDPTSVSREFLP